MTLGVPSRTWADGCRRRTTSARPGSRRRRASTTEGLIGGVVRQGGTTIGPRRWFPVGAVVCDLRIPARGPMVPAAVTGGAAGGSRRWFRALATAPGGRRPRRGVRRGSFRRPLGISTAQLVPSDVRHRTPVEEGVEEGLTALRGAGAIRLRHRPRAQRAIAMCRSKVTFSGRSWPDAGQVRGKVMPVSVRVGFQHRSMSSPWPTERRSLDRYRGGSEVRGSPVEAVPRGARRIPGWPCGWSSPVTAHARASITNRSMLVRRGRCSCQLVDERSSRRHRRLPYNVSGMPSRSSGATPAGAACSGRCRARAPCPRGARAVIQRRRAVDVDPAAGLVSAVAMVSHGQPAAEEVSPELVGAEQG